jgi:non-ribosomal peptide synthetase component F
VIGVEGVHAIASILGVWRCGVSWCAVDPDRPDHRAVIAADPPVFSAVVTMASMLDEVRGLLHATVPIICVDTLSTSDVCHHELQDDEAASMDNSSVACAACRGHQHKGDSPAYVLFTSGSTAKRGGTTIAAVVGHRAMAARFKWMLSEFPFAADDRACFTRPLTVVDAVWEAVGPLCAGVTVSAFPRSTRRDLEGLAAALKSSRVTRWLALPSVLAALCPHAALPDLRLLFASGEPLPAATVQLARRQVRTPTTRTAQDHRHSSAQPHSSLLSPRSPIL